MKKFLPSCLLSLVCGLSFSCNSHYTSVPQTGGRMPENGMGESVLPMENHPPIVSGKIDVAPALKGKVQNGSALFIIAKPVAGGPPLAVKRLSAGSFPMAFALMPQDIMMQGAPLDGAIVVLARIDKDGMAGPAGPGDLEGRTSKPVIFGAAGVNIRIDKQY